MSMDYLKKVYVPRRDDTRKITSYGYMNQWCKYSEPLSSEKRDQLLSTKLHQDAPLGPGADLVLPETPRELTPLTREMMRRRKQVADRNAREIRNKYGAGRKPETARGKLEPLSQSLDTNEYRSQNTLPDGSIIIAGRKLVPDPMTQGSMVHASYSQSGGYDDYHKTFLKLQKDGIYPSYPLYGPPRLRNGCVGGAWKHVKQVMQARGSRTLFVDGQPREIENLAMKGGTIPGTELYYPLKSDNGPLGRKAKGRHLTSPPTHMFAQDKYQNKQMEGPNWHLVR